MNVFDTSIGCLIFGNQLALLAVSKTETCFTHSDLGSYRLNTCIEWHTPILLAFHRRRHSAEEAAKETDAEQAVSKVEAAMTAAETAAKETDAAEAARAYAEEASKTLKGKRTSAKW